MNIFKLLPFILLVLLLGCTSIDQVDFDNSSITLNTKPGLGMVSIDGQFHKLPKTFNISELESAVIVFYRVGYQSRKICIDVGNSEIDVHAFDNQGGINLYPSGENIPFGISISLEKENKTSS